MLEKPDVQNQAIISVLAAEFGLDIADLAFLPLGADRNTAAYRALASDGQAYFLKLRRGAFHEASVTLPKLLSGQGVKHVVVPIEARGGRLWADLDSYTLVLYPFLEGRDGYEVALSDRQWVELGRAMRGIHSAALPESLRYSIRSEAYASQWCGFLRRVLARVPTMSPTEGVVADLIDFLEAHRGTILQLIGRTERLTQSLKADPPECVLCHSDIHAGNVLIEHSGAFSIVDWDEPILAPKERDLMFIGGGYWGESQTPEAEGLFYKGYGPTHIEARALAYYRHARVVEDAALFCEHILDVGGGLPDREQSLRYLESSFGPSGAVWVAQTSDAGDD